MPKGRNPLSENVEAVGKTLTWPEKIVGAAIVPVFCLFFFFMMQTVRHYPYALSCIPGWLIFFLIGVFFALTYVIPGFSVLDKMAGPVQMGDSINPDMIQHVSLSSFPLHVVGWIARGGAGMLLAFTLATGFLYFNIYDDDTRVDAAVRWTDARFHLWGSSSKSEKVKSSNAPGWLIQFLRGTRTEEKKIPVRLEVSENIGGRWVVHVSEGFFAMMERGLPVRAEVGRGKLGVPWIRHLYID